MKEITNESLGAVHRGSLKDNKKKNIKGITLIALVITIVVLLILAGISISALTQTGLFEKTKQAEQKYENAQVEENITLASYENEIDDTLKGSRDTVTISKEEYEKLKNANTFSEDEVKIGTWIDGKTIYQKTAVINVNYEGYNNQYKWVRMYTIADIDTLIDTKCYWGNSGSTTGIAEFHESRNYDGAVWVAGYTHGDRPITKITIKYTKTTDKVPTKD